MAGANLETPEQLENLRKGYTRAKEIIAEITELRRRGNQLTEEERAKLTEITAEHRKIVTERHLILADGKLMAAQQAKFNSSISDTNLIYAKQRGEIAGINSMYRDLGNAQNQFLQRTQQSLQFQINSANTTSEQREAIGTISTSLTELTSIQQRLAESDGLNLEQQQAIRAEYESKLNTSRLQIANGLANNTITSDQAKLLEAALRNQEESYIIAEKYATVSKETKDRIQSQVEAYNKMKNAARGTLDTIRMTLQSPQALAMAAAAAVTKIMTAALDASKKTGEFFSGYAFSTGILGLAFDDALSTSGKLAKNLGGTREVTSGLQLDILAMGTAFGVGGDAAADLFNQAGKLSGNTGAVAKDMMEATAATARMNGVLPAQMLGDMAKNTEGMMLYAKGSFDQFTKNAAAAAKLGVELSALNNMSKTLLDFESSIESELELNAMLGKEINLNRARELAYMGKQDQAAAEILRQVGGINELRKMDVFQMEQLSKTTGFSVEQLSQMVANGGKLKEELSPIDSMFDGMSETTKGLILAFGGPLIGALATVIAMMIGANSLAAKIGKSVAAALPGGGGAIGGGAPTASGGTPSAPTGNAPGSNVMGPNQQQGLDQTTRGSNAAGKGGGGIGDKLKDLAKGLKAMGNPQVLFGALNLIPTGLGFLLLMPGLPSLFFLSKIDVSRVGKGLSDLSKGLSKMALPSVFVGSLALVAAGIGFGLLTVGVLGMAAVSLLGTSAGTGLISLGTGLTAMSGGLVGAAALSVAALGFTLMTLGIPGMIGIALFGTAAGTGLTALGTGLTALSGGLVGAAALSVAALGFALMTVGLPGMIGVALLGAPASAGLIALTTGLTAFGAAAATGIPFLGVLLLAAFGAALIPLAFALSLVAPLVTAIGSVIVNVITAIAQGIATIVGSLGQFLSTIIPMMSVEAAMGVLAFAGAFVALGFSLFTLGIFGSVAIPTLLALSVFMLALGGAVAILDSSFASLSTSVSTIGETLSTLASSSFTPLFGLASALSELANSLFLVGLAGILALPVLNGLAENPLIIGAGGGEKKGENDELLNEIRGLRSDLLSGKIAVYMDGENVTAAVAGINQGNPLT